MRFTIREVEIPTFLPSEWDSLPPDQQARVQELKRKMTQYSSMLHTFKKKYHGTVIYPNSHNDYNGSNKSD